MSPVLVIGFVILALKVVQSLLAKYPEMFVVATGIEITAEPPNKYLVAVKLKGPVAVKSPVVKEYCFPLNVVQSLLARNPDTDVVA